MSACSWPGNNELMKQYHDYEWCVPSHDDPYLFEMLILEGAQSGLSWSTHSFQENRISKSIPKL